MSVESAGPVLAALLAAAAVALLAGSPSIGRARALMSVTASAPAAGSVPGDDRRGSVGTWGAAVLAAAGIAVLVGGVVGIVVAAAAAVLLRRWLSGLESGAQRRRRERIAAAGPLFADLLAAALGAGCDLRRAVMVAGDAIGGEVREVVAPVGAWLDLGAGPEQAWRPAVEAGLAGPAAVLARAGRTGSAPVPALRAWADGQRRQAAAELIAAARSSGVRAAVPTGLCFLPAFVLVGIAPLVAGLAAPLLRTP